MYNWGLSTRSTAYKERGEKLYYNDLSAMLPHLKQEYPWLADVSSDPIQQSLRRLDKAFKNFFEGRAKYPHFKKKQHAQSATYASNAFKWENGQLTLAKMNEPLSVTFHRDLPKGYISPSDCKTSGISCAPCNRRIIIPMQAPQIPHLPI